MTLPATIADAACCTPRAIPAISPEDAERIARTFKALGDPTRIRLLSDRKSVV